MFQRAGQRGWLSGLRQHGWGQWCWRGAAAAARRAVADNRGPSLPSGRVSW